MGIIDQTEHDKEQAPDECPHCHHSPVELDRPIEETHHEPGPEDEDFVVRRIVGWYCPNCGRHEKL